MARPIFGAFWIVPLLTLGLLVACGDGSKSDSDAGPGDAGDTDSDTDSDTDTDTDTDPPWESSVVWSMRIGGFGDEVANSMVSAAGGEFVVDGAFSETVTFGEGGDNETELEALGCHDAYFAQYDGAGDLGWIDDLTGTGHDAGNGMAIGSDGSVFVAGMHSDSSTFHLTAHGRGGNTEGEEGDLFVAHYFATGELDWIKHAGSDATDSGNAAFLDESGDGTLYVVGGYGSPITLGAGEANETLLLGSGQFLASYALDGALNWAVTTAEYNNTYTIGLLSDGSVAIGGELTGTSTFGAGEPNETTLNSQGSSDSWVARYNDDGTLNWAIAFGGIGYDLVDDLVVTGDDQILLGGIFSDIMTVGPGETNETELESAGDWDVFLALLADDGSLEWAKRQGGTGVDDLWDVAQRSDGAFMTTGNFNGTTVYGAGEDNETSLTAGNMRDIYFALFDADGSLQWIERAGGDSTSNLGKAIAFVGEDAALVFGDFGLELPFGNPPNEDMMLTSAGGVDNFVVRLEL